MACSNKSIEIHRDINTVRELAKIASKLLNVEMRIYKTVCYGVEIFKFSEDYPGNVVEIVRFDGYNTSGGILQNSENKRRKSTESAKRKTAEESKP